MRVKTEEEKELARAFRDAEEREWERLTREINAEAEAKQDPHRCGRCAAGESCDGI